MQKHPVPLLLALALALAACSADKLPGVYRIDVQQGNVVKQEDVNKLEIGMTKRQVLFVLGTPLVVDVFHENRWDYVFSFQPGGGERTQQRVTLLFADDRLMRIEGDLQPGVAVADEGQSDTGPVQVPLGEAEEPGFFERIWNSVGFGDD